MTNITATYVDTCYPDFLRDSYTRPGQTLLLAPLGDDLASTVESLMESMDYDAGIPGDVGDVAIARAVREALSGVDLRGVDIDGNRVDDPADDYLGGDTDTVYIYVVLEWKAPKEFLGLAFRF